MNRARTEVPRVGDPALKEWARLVVELHPSQPGGFAFRGPKLQPGAIFDLPVGAVVLVYGRVGRGRGADAVAQAFIVDGPGQPVLIGDSRSRDWASEILPILARYVQDAGATKG